MTDSVGPTLAGVDASRAFAERPTGTENYATEVLRGLAQDQRLMLRLYTRDQGNDTRVRQGLLGGDSAHPPTVRHIPAPRMWTHVSLGWEVGRRPPAVLYVPAHVMPVMTRPPAVVTVHDLGHRAFPEAHTRAQVWYLEWTTRLHARKAARLIADSESTKRDLVAMYGVSPHRIVVAPLGVDAVFHPAAPADVARARVALGLGDRRPYFLHVGTLQPRKNLQRLVRAFADIAARHPEIDLVLAGAQGWGRADPASEARRLGLEDRVRITGYMDRTYLPGAYTGALATALPSLYEGFGLSAAESMACGTPVVGSSTSSIPEVVGDAGLLVDPLSVTEIGQALDRIASDDGLRLSLAQAGLVRARKFSWETCSATVASVLLDAVRRPLSHT